MITSIIDLIFYFFSPKSQFLSDFSPILMLHISIFPELTLDEKLTFNSTTNLMGPRKFLHHGLLRKSKSSKEIVAFLFNDFLLLTYPSKSVAPQFSFDRHHDLKLRLYKKPIFLDEISVLEGKYFFFVSRFY